MNPLFQLTKQSKPNSPENKWDSSFSSALYRWAQSPVHDFSTFVQTKSITYTKTQNKPHGPSATLTPKEVTMKSKQRSNIARQNGAKAAGAKSPQGIQISSLNALRHGLLSKVLVLSTESQEKFDQLLNMYMEKFQPQDGVETNLVYEMVAAKWRQQRVWMTESTALELEMDDQQIDIDEHEAKGGEKLNMTNPRRIAMAVTRMANNEKTLELLLRYETSFSRMHDRAMKALFRLREESNLRNDPKPPESVTDPSPGREQALATLPPTPYPNPPEGPKPEDSNPTTSADATQPDPCSTVP